MRGKGTADAWTKALGPGRKASFDIHTGGPVTIGEAYGRPMVVLLGRPARQIFPGLIAVTVSVDDEVGKHRGFLLQLESQPPPAPMAWGEAAKTHTLSARGDICRKPEFEQSAETGHVVIEATGAEAVPEGGLVAGHHR